MKCELFYKTAMDVNDHFADYIGRAVFSVSVSEIAQTLTRDGFILFRHGNKQICVFTHQVIGLNEI